MNPSLVFLRELRDIIFKLWQVNIRAQPPTLKKRVLWASWAGQCSVVFGSACNTLLVQPHTATLHLVSSVFTDRLKSRNIHMKADSAQSDSNKTNKHLDEFVPHQTSKPCWQPLKSKLKCEWWWLFDYMAHFLCNFLQKSFLVKIWGAI